MAFAPPVEACVPDPFIGIGPYFEPHSGLLSCGHCRAEFTRTLDQTVSRKNSCVSRRAIENMMASSRHRHQGRVLKCLSGRVKRVPP